MRITFERMVDRRPVETLVERDDGVVFRMRGAGGGVALPHDPVHVLVEQELGVSEGIWGCVADGVVWRSMRHVPGRQPPHAAERSDRLKKERAGRVRVAWEALDGAAAAVASSAARWAQLVPGERWTVSWPAPPRRGSTSGRWRPGRGPRGR